MGSTAVVFLTGLGEGARGFVMEQFTSLGSNLVIVMPGRNETTGSFPGVGGVPNDLTLDDALALQRELRGARRVIPMASATSDVSHRELRRQVVIMGTTRDFFYAQNLRIGRGNLLPESKFDRGAPLAVVGHKLAERLFLDADPVGKIIRVGDARIRVTGVLAPRGTQMGQNIDELIFLPVQSVMQIFNRSSLFRILVDLNAFADAELIKQRIIALITERHDEEDITCITQEAVLDSLSSIVKALSLAISGIGGISLAVAGIGIMNVMLVTVSERTAEVGLLKALGAGRAQVLAVFLTEATLLSSAGGIIGLAIGSGFLHLLTSFYPAVPATTPLWAIVGVLALAMSTGPIFGVMPAIRAMRLDPVDALTHS
jgi:putative ABC transport system permease protein